MFEGFEDLRVDVSGLEIACYTGGEGPPLLLLHGFPQTRHAFAALAPLLAPHVSLIIPDLPGYGASSTGPADAQHTAQSKREMARVVKELMASLGHDSFALAGHDRGGRVAYRLALDHPQCVTHLALLDIATTLDTWEAMDWQAAIRAYHWPFLAQPAPFPEEMIGRDPPAYLDHLLTRWKGAGFSFPPEVLSAYRAAISQPATIAAMAEDYRAGASTDVAIDKASRAEGARITCPLLLLRGTQYEPRALTPFWQGWADDITEITFDCGHFIAEEVPERAADALLSHFGKPV